MFQLVMVRCNGERVPLKDPIEDLEQARAILHFCRRELAAVVVYHEGHEHARYTH